MIVCGARCAAELQLSQVTVGDAMAIQELQVHGFRSLRDATWRPGRLNLLVGPNSSGKSNVLRCLELISESAKGHLESTVAACGGFLPLLWDYQAQSLGWKLRVDPVHRPSDATEHAITYELQLAHVRGGSGYDISRESLGNWHKFESGHEPTPFFIFQRDSKGHVISGKPATGLIPVADEPEPNETLLSQYAIVVPDNNTTRLFRRGTSNWQIHHDVRAERDSVMRQPATTQFAKRLTADGGNLVTVLHTLYTGNREFRSLIDEGMKAGFGEDYQEVIFQPAAAQQIQLALQWKSSSQPHAGADLSDGTLRFLFLIAVLAHPEPPPLIAIDEPEVGLHPSMLPIIAEYASAATEKTQVVLTSHSPEFLDAFSDLSPHVTLCHWEDGKTDLYALDEQTLEKWLQRYRLGHLFTCGDLESLAMPEVESLADINERFADLPSEDQAMADLGHSG